MVLSGPLFSAGDCPVCADSGALLVLRRADLPVLFFFCTACGNAFRERPEPPTALNEINRLRDLAPVGIAIPEIGELVTVGGLVPADAQELEDLLWHCERELAAE